MPTISDLDELRECFARGSTDRGHEFAFPGCWDEKLGSSPAGLSRGLERLSVGALYRARQLPFGGTGTASKKVATKAR